MGGGEETSGQVWNGVAGEWDGGGGQKWGYTSVIHLEKYIIKRYRNNATKTISGHGTGKQREEGQAGNRTDKERETKWGGVHNEIKDDQLYANLKSRGW